MYTITKSLKRFAVETLGVAEGATDDAVRSAVAAGLQSGKVTRERLKSLTGGKPAKAAKATKPAPAIDAAAVAELVTKRVEAELERRGVGAASAGVASPMTAFGPAGKLGSTGTVVRVKSAAERYSDTKRQAICPERTLHGKSAHPTAGRPATHDGRVLDEPSELDKAISGAYFKFCLYKSHAGDYGALPRALRMTEHDVDLFNYALRNKEWTGVVNNDDDNGSNPIKVNRRRLTDFEVKAILDNPTDGGIEAAPIVFDDAVILFPILHSELFNRVNVVNLTRGRRVEGFSIGNPTFTSGTAEGTAITPFDTTGFIAAFDTNIYNAVGSMEIGMDFEEDAPNDIGGIVVQQYGMKSLEYLDRVIAVGNGTNEPEGVFNATGTTAVVTDNGTGGPPTVSDWEGLMFGVAKEYRFEAGAQPVFLSNDTTYRRLRGIPIGPADQRRVYGMNHQSYKTFEYDHAIQNNIANTRACFFNPKRYRMYRRLGLNVRMETSGNYLSLRNLRLIVVRMRFGGRLELGGAAAVSTTMQS